MIKFSVIIPVYNVEKYLPQCLDSILTQSYNNLEVIAVDDGSTDNSGKILDTYASKDKRLTVIHQSNSGVSKARNTGLNIASGEYISFVDGDDLLVKDTYKELATEIANAPQTDIFTFCFYSLSGEEIRNNTNNLTELQKYIKYGFSKKDFIWKLGGSVWSKIFKQSFLKENHIYFAEGVPLAEDGLFCTECAAYNPKIQIIPKAYYIYRIFRENSTMSSQHELDKEMLCRNYMISQPYYQQATHADKLIMDLKICSNLIYRHTLLSKEKQLSNLKYLQDYQTYLTNTYTNEELNKEHPYKALIKQIKTNGKEPLSFLQHCFSIKNTRDKKFKQIHLLGLKFHIKRRPHKIKNIFE